jgi:hypothetical protein
MYRKIKKIKECNKSQKGGRKESGEKVQKKLRINIGQ